ncbi:MAG: hypothetical protein J5817_02505, partial [Treponema sp.]|nr:hypothetical protein [Treponema sp.]
RKNYIAKKLEQLHPCFSDNCCYDAKYRLKKGKLIAAVAVMDKVKLAEYKTGDKKHLPLKFGEENKLEFFNSEKLLNISLALAIAFLAALLSISYALHSKAKNQAQVKKNANSSTSTLAAKKEAEDFDKAIQQNIVQAYKTLDDFLQSTQKSGGRIKNCSLIFLEDQSNEQAYKMNFSMKECFPQDFPKEEEEDQQNQRIFSAVTYSNSKPEFSASLYGKAKNVIKLKQELSKSQIDDIRLSIWSCNGILLTDFSDEGIVEFSFQNKSAEKILENLKNVCKEHSIFPAAIEIEPGKFNTRMKIIFAEKINAENFNPLALLKDYSIVFSENYLQKAKPMQTKNSAARNVVATKENPAKDESFGKIIQKDGSVLVFYKNSQGKIRGEKQ